MKARKLCPFCDTMVRVSKPLNYLTSGNFRVHVVPYRGRNVERPICAGSGTPADDWIREIMES